MHGSGSTQIYDDPGAALPDSETIKGVHVRDDVNLAPGRSQMKRSNRREFD
jgi:hypothetical protein